MYGNWRIKSVAVDEFSGRRGVGKIMRNTFRKTFIDLSNEIFCFSFCIYFLLNIVVVLCTALKKTKHETSSKLKDSGGSLRSLCL